MRRDRDMPVQLPAEVVELLNTKGIPKTATSIRRTEGVNMPLTTRGCQELAARMKAEREVFEEAQKLDIARGEAATIEDLRTTVTALEEQNRQLRDENAQLRGEVTRQTAASAMVVHGEGSQR